MDRGACMRRRAARTRARNVAETRRTWIPALGPLARQARPAPSKSSNQSDQPALNVDLIGTEDARLIVGIGSLERDRSPLLAQAFEGRLLLLDQSDDDVAVFGGVAALADDDVALVDAGLDHRITP